MPDFAELELHLQRRDEQTCVIGFRFTSPKEDAARIEDHVGVFRIPKLHPRAAQVDPLAYGEQLTKALFQDKAVLDRFASYRDMAQAGHGGLRLRLVAPPELQSIRWETLLDPAAERVALFAGGQIHFSRYLSSANWRPVRSKAKASLRSLIVIANPAGEFHPQDDDADASRLLAPVDVAGELQRAEEALAATSITKLASGGTATLANLSAKLADGVDILYLVCHGALIEGEPQLWLEREDPNPDAYFPVSASELIRQIGNLDHPPRLVVLASCQSAGSARDSGVLAALGPRLAAEAAVPAVIAMQGNITMETVKLLLPVFFGELMEDGQIDRALTVARGRAQIAGRPDYWMPVLFTRLQSGALWYTPGFGLAENEEFGLWDALRGFLHRDQCVPIIGPDLGEHIFGSTRQLAQTLAERKSFPGAVQDQHDLAKVAQFVCTNEKIAATRQAVRELLAEQALQSASRLLPAGFDKTKLIPLLAEKLASDENDPLQILASLNASVYVTASTDALFEAILKQNGSKQPRPVVMNWRDERRVVKVENQRSVYKSQTEEFFGDPTPTEPYLYYIFGKRFSKEESTWVLTEDEVFDYLIQVSRYDLIPQVVADSLGSKSLLFLGFPLEDWKFKVLFRMILAIEGNAQIGQFSHVGVQVDPDQTTLPNAAAARKHLEQYFTTPYVMRDNLPKPSISIYWGSAADFLRALHVEMKKPVEVAVEA